MSIDKEKVGEDINYRCIFCGRTTLDTVKEGKEPLNLITSPFGNMAICFDCVKTCNDVVIECQEVKKEATSISMASRFKDLKPIDIKNFLDEYVIGQEKAKVALSVAIYNHYKKVRNNLLADDNNQIEKSNVLLIGRSGSGKTLLAKNIAKLLDVPFCICDATSYTEAGYVGDDVENVIKKLFQNSGNDVAKTEMGIVFIDEIDKITRKTSTSPSGRDVSGEGVQQAFLKIIEGSDVNIKLKDGAGNDSKTIKISTKNILFIFGGAFVGLNEMKDKELNKDNSAIGFGRSPKAVDEKEDKSSEYDYVSEDLIKYGFIPEFAGRIPIIIGLDELTEDDLLKILTEPKDSIVKQFKKLMKLDGITLRFGKDVLKSIAHYAKSTKTGARALRNAIEKIMLKHMYEAPSQNIKSLTITMKDIRENGLEVKEKENN